MNCIIRYINYLITGQDITNLEIFYDRICYHITNWIKIRDNKIKNTLNLAFDDSNNLIVGLHGTTTECANSILKNGFDNRDPKAVILGETENWPIAMFSNPFVINGEKRCPNEWISFTMGVHRTIIRDIFVKIDKYGKDFINKEYSNGISFPIIIAIFKKSEKIILDKWIQSWNPNDDVIIIGIITVSFSIDEILNRYSLHKKNKLDCFTYKNKINYSIEWIK